MDGQHTLGPTQSQKSDDDRLLPQKSGLRNESTFAESVERASKGSLAESLADAELVEELFGGPTESALPQLDGSAVATEYDATAEAPGCDPNSMRDAADSTQPAANNDPVASSAVTQHTTVVDRTSQHNAIEPQGPDASSDAQPSAAALMPPPTVPASMLPQLQPSRRAKNATEQIEDPAVVARLISVSVTLFRQGGEANAKKLAHFSIDLIGKQKWDEELPAFMQAPPLPSDSDSVLPLLSGTVDILRPLDRISSAFLEGMLYAWS